MKKLYFVALGALFGLLLTKSDVISWFRIQEMFRFQSFHLYGIIGSAVAVGAVSLFLMKKFGVTAPDGSAIGYPVKSFNHGTWIGGLLFGMGWAFTGACPGTMYAQLGAGHRHRSHPARQCSGRYLGVQLSAGTPPALI